MKSTIRCILWFALVWTSVLHAQTSLSPEVSAAADQAALMVGPITGFTVGWHEAPQTITVPRGTSLTFQQPKAPQDDVEWEGADEIEDGSTSSLASFTTQVPGRFEVTSTTVLSLGSSAGAKTPTNRCVIEVVERVPVSLASPAPITVDHGSDLAGYLSNEETMGAFFGGSIARVSRLSASRYVTSIQKPLTFGVAVAPDDAWPIEWVVDGVAVGLGSTWHGVFVEPGVHTVSVTRAGVQQWLDMETYSVSIAPTDEFVVGQPLRFRATTEPAGYETHITWLSSTKTGTAAPVLGGEPVFTAVFENDTLDGSWTGVKADNAVAASDAVTCPAESPSASVAASDLRIELGPIAGLTRAWHAAPASTHVPVGVSVMLRAEVVLVGDIDGDGLVSHFDTEDLRGHMAVQGQPGAWRADIDGSGVVDGFDFAELRALYGATSQGAAQPITWDGARSLPSDGAALAELEFSEPGDYTVTAEAVVDGVLVSRTMTFTAVDLPASGVNFSIVGVTPVDPSDGTIFSFLMGSPAVIAEVDGVLATSVRRSMRLSVQTTPAGFEPLTEWMDGDTVFEVLGDGAVVSLARAGGHVLTGGWEGSVDGIPIVAFETIIEPSPDVERLDDETPITLYARTEPAGFEDLICWRASTVFGHTEVELGRGPVFSTSFHDTTSSYGDRWVNIRACDAVYDLEALLAPKCADFCCQCGSAFNCVGKLVFIECESGKFCNIVKDCGIIFKCCGCS